MLNIAYVKTNENNETKSKELIFEESYFDYLKNMNIVFNNNFNNIKMILKKKMMKNSTKIKVDEKKNIYVINNFNKKTIGKLDKLLEKNNVDYVIVENDNDVNYKKLNGNLMIKYILPEIKNYISQRVNFKFDEIYLTVNGFTDENIQIINDLYTKTKVLNIVTKNNIFYNYEKKLEEKEIYINVLSNKNKCLRNADLVINLDFENYYKYNLNRNMILIDVSNKINNLIGFNGIIIKNCEINTKKIMRIFNEFNNFNKSKLLEKEILNINNYNEKRNFILMNKIYVSNLFNNNEIENEEFYRINKLINSNNKNKNDKIIAKALN